MFKEDEMAYFKVIFMKYNISLFQMNSHSTENIFLLASLAQYQYATTFKGVKNQM